MLSSNLQPVFLADGAVDALSTFAHGRTDDNTVFVSASGESPPLAVPRPHRVDSVGESPAMS